MPYRDVAKRRDYGRQYRKSHRDQRKTVAPFQDSARHANERAAQYGCTGRLTAADVRAVMSVGACHYCGSTRLLGIDHVIPLHRAGPNTRGNIVCCCRSCNARKRRGHAPNGEWADAEPQCRGCGTTERPHVAKGLCNACYCRAKHRARVAAERGDREAVSSTGIDVGVLVGMARLPHARLA